MQASKEVSNCPITSPEPLAVNHSFIEHFFIMLPLYHMGLLGCLRILVCFFGFFLGVLLGPAIDAFLSSDSSKSLEEEVVVDEEADDELSAPPPFFSWACRHA